MSGMYKSNIAAILVESEVSGWYGVESGVKKGCVLWPFK
jgi:hypothetical protein